MHKKQSRVSTEATNTKPNTKQCFEPPQGTLTKLVWRGVVNHCPTLLLQGTSLVTFRSCNIVDRTCLIPSGSLWLWPHWQSNSHLAHSRFGRIRTVVLCNLCVPKSTKKTELHETPHTDGMKQVQNFGQRILSLGYNILDSTSRFDRYWYDYDVTYIKKQRRYLHVCFLHVQKDSAPICSILCKSLPRFNMFQHDSNCVWLLIWLRALLSPVPLLSSVLHPLTASHHFIMDTDADAASSVSKNRDDLLNVPPDCSVCVLNYWKLLENRFLLIWIEQLFQINMNLWSPPSSICYICSPR